MAGILVDSNVLLDVLTADSAWYRVVLGETPMNSQSVKTLVINPIIYAEISIGFHTIEELEYALLGHSDGTPPDSVGGGLPGRQVLPAIPPKRRRAGAPRCRISSSARTPPSREWAC